MTELEATRLKLQALELVEGIELKWWEVIKYNFGGQWCVLASCPTFHLEISDYELALYVLDNKPVWKGDLVYSQQGCAFYANHPDELVGCSWNPPKPETVMVELPIKLVEFYVIADMTLSPSECEELYAKRNEACRKALEGLK